MIIKIETERLALRNLELNDVSQDYADWLNDPRVNKYLSCAKTFQTIETCRSYVKFCQQQINSVLIGVFLKKNALHIGNLTLTAIDWRYKTAAIGISIGRKKYMGKGLAREALTAIVGYCFQQLGFCRLWAGVNVSNIKSLNLFIKSGFKIEKFLKESKITNNACEDGYIMFIFKSDSIVINS